MPTRLRWQTSGRPVRIGPRLSERSHERVAASDVTNPTMYATRFEVMHHCVLLRHPTARAAAGRERLSREP